MAELNIGVAFAAPGTEAIVHLTLPVGATVAQAVAASGLCERLALSPATIGYAIHGQRVDMDTPLVEGDRIELTRPLIADAKQARRARAARQPQAKQNSRSDKPR